MKMNKTLQRKLKAVSDKDLIIMANAFKIENRTNNNGLFQKNYNTIINELELRKQNE